MNVGILTAGGVCPGVNTLIRSITLREKNQGNQVHGFSDGFRGLNQNVKTYFDQEHIDEGPGTLLKTSYDYVDINQAVKNLRDFDRLYCICGNESMKSARDLALDERVDTNIIGIAKTVFNDIPGVESLGFQTAVQELARYIDCAYIEAISTNSIVFLEVPGKRNSDLATHAGLARNSKITNVITSQTKADYRSAIEYSYANRGYAVVVISEMCDYDHLLTSMSVKPKVITPGYLIRDVEPCVYDSILAERMVREAFEFAQENRDFIKGATNIVKFKDYLRIV
jgi:6-phosphofructokinase